MSSSAPLPVKRRSAGRTPPCNSAKQLVSHSVQCGKQLAVCLEQRAACLTCAIQPQSTQWRARQVAAWLALQLWHALVPAKLLVDACF